MIAEARWKQRFENLTKAFNLLEEAATAEKLSSRAMKSKPMPTNRVVSFTKRLCRELRFDESGLLEAVAE